MHKDALAFPDVGMEIRKEILLYSLIVESFTSIFLSLILGMDNYKESRTLGNKGSNLSLSNKIDLLIDIGALEGETRSKFQVFMEIRNQFAHNLESSSYEKCFEFISHNINFLRKRYPQSEADSNEDQLKKATIALATDVINFTFGLVEKVKDKIRKDVELDMYKKTQEVLIKYITNQPKKKLDIITTKSS